MLASHSTPPRLPNLFLVTDRHATAGRDLVDVVTRALDAGLPGVQLREKDLPGRTLFDLAVRLRAASARTGAFFIVNDRIDVAVAVGADAVQLGQASVPVDVARPLVSSRCLIGQSTHSPDEVASSTADFVLFGPVYDTPSKRAFGRPHGEDGLRAAAAATRIPVIAIGGIDVDRAHRVMSTGIAGVAVIRAILGAEEPAAATRALLRALSR